MGQDCPRAGGGMELQEGWANPPAGACWCFPVRAEPWLFLWWDTLHDDLHAQSCLWALCLHALFQINCCSFLNAQCPDLVLTLQEKQGLVGFLSLCWSFPAWEVLLFLCSEFSKDKHLWCQDYFVDVWGLDRCRSAQGRAAVGQDKLQEHRAWAGAQGAVGEGQWHCCRHTKGQGVESKGGRKDSFARTQWWEGRKNLFWNQKICVWYPESCILV